MTPETGKLDSDGTTAGAATQMLQKVYGEGFDRDAKSLAIALGRSQEEVEHALSGNAEAFDDDFVMKIRGLAKERGIEI